jgi:hypothetical protein
MIKEKTFPVCKIIYGWLQSARNFILLMIALYACYNWVQGQFTDIKALIADVRDSHKSIDTINAKLPILYAMCYKNTARIDTVEWRIADWYGSDSILTDEVIRVKSRVTDLENK